MGNRLACILLLAALAAAPTAGQSRKQASVPTTVEEFDRLVEGLAVEADAFASSKDDKGPQPSPTVATVRYSEQSVTDLGAALKAAHGQPPSNLFVLYQLTLPLLSAGDETLRKVRPELTSLLQQHCRYKPMPTLTASQAADLKSGEGANLQAKARADKARREKESAERAVVKCNRAVAALEANLKMLLIMTGEDEADEPLLARLAKEEADRLVTYKGTLDAIKDEVVRMSQERAKLYYDRLRALAEKVGVRRRGYRDPATPEYNPAGNSAFKAEACTFAVDVLKVVNLLATAAKEPAVNIPGVKPPRNTGRPRGRGR
jgi:hypothetical protein